MAFTVEDGTGLPDANSYASVAEYKAYFADRGISTVGETDEQIQGWLVQATDFSEVRWGDRLKGCPISQTQALHFPADGVYIGGVLQPSDAVPTAQKRATIEYARLAKSGPLWKTPQVDASGRVLTAKRERVGPLEREWGYLPGATVQTPAYPTADKLMKPLLTGAGGGVIRN